MMDIYENIVIGPQYGRCCDCQRWLMESERHQCQSCAKRWQESLDALKKSIEACRNEEKT